MKTKKFTISITFFEVLFLVLMVLKLCGVIDWSWWWITAPVWLPIAFTLSVWCLVSLFIGVAILARIFK